MNIIPQEIKSPTKLVKGVFFRDLIFIGMYYLVFDSFKLFVNPSIQILYTVFNIIIPFILTRPSPYNEGRYIWQTILFYFLKDKNTYHIDYIDD